MPRDVCDSCGFDHKLDSDKIYSPLPMKIVISMKKRKENIQRSVLTLELLFGRWNVPSAKLQSTSKAISLLPSASSGLSRKRSTRRPFLLRGGASCGPSGSPACSRKVTQNSSAEKVFFPSGSACFSKSDTRAKHRPSSSPVSRTGHSKRRLHTCLELVPKRVLFKSVTFITCTIDRAFSATFMDSSRESRRFRNWT